MRRRLASSKSSQNDLGTAAPTATLHVRKQQFVREEIWDAAIRLFAEKGFDSTTVNDIARESGVSRRSFFRYFASKNDLLAQGIVTYGAAVSDAIDRCPREYSLSDVVRQTVRDVAQLAASSPRTPTLIQIATKYPAAREAQLSRMGEVQERVALMFAKRCKMNRKRDDLAPKVLSRLTLSAIDTALQHWFEHGGGDILPIVEQVFSMLSEFVCPAGTTAARSK